MKDENRKKEKYYERNKEKLVETRNRIIEQERTIRK